MSKLDNWWSGKCKSCRYYHLERHDNFDVEGIFPGMGHCHFDPPCVLMSPEGKPTTVRPEVTVLDDCGSWQLSTDVQLQRSNHKGDKK